MNEEKKRKILVIIIGWTGTILIITAYVLNSFNYITSQNIIYPFLNLLGAVLMGIRVFIDKNWSNFILEIFWFLIAAYSIFLLLFSGNTAVAATLSETCPNDYIPVCGISSNVKRTYTNSCSAKFNNAKILYSGECLVPSCPSIYNPVCAVKYSGQRTYHNKCQADWHGAKILYNGECINYVCKGKQSQVCAEKNGEQKTYKDYCAAMNAKAKILYTDICQEDKTVTNCTPVLPPDFDCSGSIVPIRDEDGCTSGYNCILDAPKELRATEKAPNCTVIGDSIDFLYRKKISYGRFLIIRNSTINNGLFFETNGYKAFLPEEYRDLIIEGSETIFVGTTPILIYPDDILTKATAALKIDNNNPYQMILKITDNQTFYEISFTVHKKVLGLFNKKVKMIIQLNPETGEIIKIDKPWYIF